MDEVRKTLLALYKTTFKLLLEVGLNKQAVDNLVLKRSTMQARHGFTDLVTTCQASQIPFLILSAGTWEPIHSLVEKVLPSMDGVPIVSNSCIDQDLDEMVTAFNKRNTLSKHPSFLEASKGRPNAIVLGDIVADSQVLVPEDHDTILKIGYFNRQENKEEMEE
eukprot:CAMPEP_0170488390 /NCGR_PEP_ID=MMETSP0208-20121228/6954_1 /TAXON_ID=197538 /ORGANISM="Strombidium inclinatum, Strain S3" /LENGTH=163 /DNA_ID=CAMNT_0010762937 /DNA_START=326 /DNA_END=814 /DNA_ORIENTATION=-